MDIFHPFQYFADLLVFDLLNLNPDSHLGIAFNFFIYDSLKIILLLLIINYLMAVIRHYLPIEKLRNFLTSRKLYGLEYFFAAIFGTITPFCSCSSIPLFVGFVGAGIPLGITLSFLITSPLVNEAAVALFVGMFGWKITIYYVAASVLLGVVAGFILDKLNLEKYIDESVLNVSGSESSEEKNGNDIGWAVLLKKFWQEGWDLTKKLIPYVLLGIGVGSIIHGYVPSNFFEEYIKADNLLAVPIATIAAVPIYANSVGVIPIIESLVAKGIPLGTALSFMMAVVGLSLPEALILKKVMKTKLLIYFFGITTINIIIIGYLFNIFVG